MLFEHTFIERRIVKIWKNNGVKLSCLSFDSAAVGHSYFYSFSLE